MKRFVSMLSGCALIALQACAIRPEVADLTTVDDSADVAVVPADYSYDFRNDAGETIHVHLMAGTYRLKRENAVGRFFESDHGAVWWQVEQRRSVLLFVGGVWTPKDARLPPRIYHLWSPMFVGPTLEEAKQKERKARPPATTGTNDTVVNAVLNSPARLSPVQAGLAGAVAGVILSAAVGNGPRIKIIPFTRGAKGEEDADRLRAAFRFEREVLPAACSSPDVCPAPVGHL